MKRFYPARKPLAVVLDDHQLFADSFTCLIEKTGLFEHIHSFTEEGALTDFLLKMKGQPGLFLFADYYLRNTTALRVIQDLQRIYRPIYVVIVSCVTNPILINDILTYRIDGFLSKSSRSDEIVSCIQAIQSGREYISPVIGQMLSAYNQGETNPFSAREVEILIHFANGLTVNATAEKMILSRHTIVSHRRRMMDKTRTKTITELLAYARKIDLI
ncbi:two-component system response regulator DegU [Ravibacter arvi]|uniref:Two-component system response regulator DegU n=1 Tax=Ravibacter arvi TaxID=2051041 RepID=A0ABP8LV16_9BACT